MIQHSIKEAAPHRTKMKWRNHVLCANAKETRAEYSWIDRP